MEGYISIKHSYNCGDLISILPGLRQLYRDTGKKIKIYQRLNLKAFFYDGQINSTIDINGDGVCMNERLFYMMKPLVESLEYVHSFEIWEGQEVRLDYDLTRDTRCVPMPAGIIHSWPEALFPETSTDISEKWINIPDATDTFDKKLLEYYSDKVIINRTQRYNNPYITYFFLKDFESKVVFSGTDAEYDAFLKEWKINIEKVESVDFFHLCQIINSCRFGVYNQSLHFHLADAMKTKRVLELCPPFPNTFITGANGHQFYKQSALEFYFKKLIQ